MKFNYRSKPIHTFAISPRTRDAGQYWKNIEKVSQWCADYQFTGPLLFTGNDTYVEPWVCAQEAVSRFGVSPLVAVNPIYMHPFTAAKMVSSFASVFQKQIFLNMVTGTSLSQHAALADPLDHDQKYDRLLEYIQIIQMLIGNSPKPVSFEGSHYTVNNLALEPPVPENLSPGYFIAGHSAKAQFVRDQTGAVGMQMLLPRLAEAVEGARGIHFGVMTRASEKTAWNAANERFPENERGKFVLERSMKNTDSVWKKRLKFAADTEDQCDNGYWLAPFRNFQADCPYFIGSHQQLSDLIVSLVSRGIETIILDIPSSEQEFAEVATAFQMAKEELSADVATAMPMAPCAR